MHGEQKNNSNRPYTPDPEKNNKSTAGNGNSLNGIFMRPGFPTIGRETDGPQSPMQRGFVNLLNAATLQSVIVEDDLLGSSGSK